MGGGSSLHYRMLRRRIRPARVATSIYGAADDWQPAVMRMLENYSVTWGGLGNILIPTDQAGQIHEAFWPLIEIFDADVWATYTITRRGIEMANPDGFRDWLNREARKWARKHGGGIAKARELLTAEHMMTHVIGGWPPPDALRDEVRRRTAPAIEHESFVFSMYRADGPPGQHIVDVCDLEPLPERVRLLDTQQLPTALQLLVAMHCGGLAPSHTQRLVDAGVAVDVVPIDDDDLDSLLRLAWFGPLARAGSYSPRPLPTSSRPRRSLRRTTSSRRRRCHCRCSAVPGCGAGRRSRTTCPWSSLSAATRMTSAMRSRWTDAASRRYGCRRSSRSGRATSRARCWTR